MEFAGNDPFRGDSTSRSGEQFGLRRVLLRSQLPSPNLFAARLNRPNEVLAHERFKREDARSYDLAAETFERLSATYSAPFAEALVRTAGVSAGYRVLDLGAGTGIVSRHLKAAGALCIAADLSSGMLSIASRSSPAVLMDAESFAIRPDSLDAVVSLFAMMHFPAPETVLRA